QLDLGNVFQSNDGIVFGTYHQTLELVEIVQVGTCLEVDGHHRALGTTHRRQDIVGLDRAVHIRRRDTQCRHAIRLQPGAHRKGTITENLRTLHTGNGRQFRLYHAHQVVSDLVVVEQF